MISNLAHQTLKCTLPKSADLNDSQALYFIPTLFPCALKFHMTVWTGQQNHAKTHIPEPSADTAQFAKITHVGGRLVEDSGTSKKVGEPSRLPSISDLRLR